ncbi:MAG: transcriptional regulator, PadR family [Acidobacteria bacterium]|nr:transcriptional regulator, PadR family [Acidobacteriota bacterium]
MRIEHVLVYEVSIAYGFHAKNKTERVPARHARHPMHGYGIAQFLRRRTEDVLQVGEGSLYPALQRLQVQGLLAAGWRQSDTGRRAKYYRLTSLGRAYLEAERESYGRVSGAIARVLQEV